MPCWLACAALVCFTNNFPLEGLPSQAPPRTAGWIEDGFYLRSPDRDFQLRLTGQIQSDFRAYLNDRDQRNVDSFVVRRARLGIEAVVARYYEFRFLSDFGLLQPRIVDSFLNIRYWDAFQIELGKFKQPFSFEQLVQDRFVPTLERSLIDQFVPARDVGIMIHGQRLWSDRLDYGVAIANGIRDGDIDTNGNKDFSARLALRPFAPRDEWALVRHLQIGMAVTTGRQLDAAAPAVFSSGGGTTWFAFLPGTAADGVRTRWSPELLWFFRGLGASAQYFRMDQALRSVGGVRSNVPWEGFYVLGTMLWTGEERTSYSQAVRPLRPFDPRNPLAAPGAWESVLRVSRVVVGENVFGAGVARLADPAQFSPGATELIVGTNWYLNAWIRGQLNWERLWFDRPVQLGPAPVNQSLIQDTLLLRMQIVF